MGDGLLRSHGFTTEGRLAGSIVFIFTAHHHKSPLGGIIHHLSGQSTARFQRPVSRIEGRSDQAAASGRNRTEGRGVRPWQAQAGDRLMFIGAYRHSVDAKGRVAIPARFRAQLEEGAVVVCWVEGCAAIFPRAAFEQMAAKFASQPLGSEDARAVSRHVFASAFDLEKDAQGRVVLPQSIREWAGLGSEAVIVGAGDRVDIWSPEMWASKSLTPESFTSRLSGLSL